MSPSDHMKRVQLERDVLDAKNKLAAARVEWEMALEDVSAPKPSALVVATLSVAVERLVETECRHAVAVDRFEAFKREVMS